MPHKVAVTFQAEMKSFVESDSSRVNSTVSHLHVSHCPGGAGGGVLPEKLGGVCGPLKVGGYSQKNWVGVCGMLPKTLTLFMTKICNFPYPIYDLT